MRVSIQQLAITVAATAFAGFALLSGLDRLAAQDPALPAVIHWLYARDASINAAYAAAAHREFGKSTALMNEALLADPLNEAVIGGLGRVRLSAGDDAGADAAFRVSALRGWRDQATHTYWMERSIEAQDFKSAALHADALLFSPLSEPAQEQVFDTLLQYDEGRNALAALLRTRPAWASGVAFDIDHATDNEVVAHADLIARTGPGIWSCLDTAGLVDRLVEAGDTRDALAAHDATCAQNAKSGGPGNFVNDPHFLRYLADGRASHLDWFAPESGDVAISPAMNPTTHGGVQITSTRGVAEEVMAQRVAIAPGAYTLSWQMPNTDPAAAASLVAGLDCGTDLARTTAGTPVPGKPGTFAIDVRFTGTCVAPTIAFWLRATDKSVTLDTITLHTAGH